VKRIPRLTVLTPARTLLDVEQISWVEARLADGGPIGIHPGHAPLLAETVAAPLRYADTSGEHEIDLDAGLLQVNGDGVTVFANSQTWEVSSEPGGRTTSQVLTDQHFDQLAQELFTTLDAQPDGVLNDEKE
jgi:F0F1-type ATP synthase epsilon subunit